MNPIIDRLNALLKMDDAFSRIENAASINQNNNNSAGNENAAQIINPRYDDLIAEILSLLITVIDCISFYYRTKEREKDNGKNNTALNKLPSYYEDMINDSVLDLVDYIVATGIIDKLANKLEQIRVCIDDNSSICHFIINTASFISVISQLLSSKILRFGNSENNKENSNFSVVKAHFTQSCEQTDFVAIIPALYTFLVLSGSSEPRPTIFDGSRFGDQDSIGSFDNLNLNSVNSEYDVQKTEHHTTQIHSPRNSSKNSDNSKPSLLKKNAIPTARLPYKLAKVTFVCLQSLNLCFSLNMKLENIQGPTHMTIHLFRHVFNYLLWHLTTNDENSNPNHNSSSLFSNKKHSSSTSSSHHNHQSSPLEDEIILELIKLIGYFTVGNTNNQNFLAEGVQPTVLEQLCALPFSFFNDRIRRKNLLATLFCICYQNEHNIEMLHGLDMDIQTISEEVHSNREKVDIFRNVGKEFWVDVEESNLVAS